MQHGRHPYHDSDGRGMRSRNSERDPFATSPEKQRRLHAALELVKNRFQ